MPKWLKVAIEIAITWLKRTGRIDPSVDKKSNANLDDKTRAAETVRSSSVHSRD
jgi:hypothetical protein